MRFFRALFLSLPALCLGAANAQTTTITATQQYWGSSPMAHGQLIFIAVTPAGKPQTFSANGRLYPAGDLVHLNGGFVGGITAGALTNSFAVPDKASASSAYPLCYDVQLLNTDAGAVTDLGVRCDITGSTVSMDTYVAPTTSPVLVTGYTHGAASAIPSSCSAGALYNADNTNVLSACGTDSTFHAITGSSIDSTARAAATSAAATASSASAQAAAAAAAAASAQSMAGAALPLAGGVATGTISAPVLNSKVNNGQVAAGQYSSASTSTGVAEYNATVPAVWAASTAYALNAQVYTGQYIWKVTTAGTSGTTEPTWSGGPQTDGSVVWTNTGVGIPDVHIEPGNTGANIYQMPTSGSGGYNYYNPSFTLFGQLRPGTHLFDHRSGQLTDANNTNSANTELFYQPCRWSTFCAAKTVNTMFGSARASDSFGNLSGGYVNRTAVAFNTMVYGHGTNPGLGWTTSRTLNSTFTKNALGIGQNTGLSSFCYGNGDCSALYSYLYFNGGCNDPSCETINGFSNHVVSVPVESGVLTAAYSAGALTISTKHLRGAPSPGNYLVNEASAVPYYIASTGDFSAPHAWSQYITLSTVSGSTLPSVSTAHGTLSACTSPDAFGMRVRRTCTVSIDSVIPGGAFTTGNACFSGGQTEVVTISAVSGSGSTQTVTVTGSQQMAQGGVTTEELWQGGPCGKGLVVLQGASQAEVFATQNYVALQVVGSPSAGVIAVNQSSHGAVNFSIHKKDYTVGGLYLGRSSGTVTIAQGSPTGEWIPSQETITVTASDASFNTTLAHTSYVPGLNGGIPPVTYSPVTTAGTYAQAGADGGTGASIALGGLDGAVLVSEARIMAASEPLADASFTLEIDPNTLPSMANGAGFTQAHFLDQEATGDFLNTADMGKNMQRFVSRSTLCYLSSAGVCFETSTDSDPRFTPLGMSFKGYYNGLIDAPAPTSGKLGGAIQPFIRMRCPGYPYIQCSASGGLRAMVQAETNNGSPNLSVDLTTGSTFGIDASSQWLVRTPAVGAGSPSTKIKDLQVNAVSFLGPYGVLTPFIAPLHRYDGPNQPLAVGPITNASDTTGVASGTMAFGTVITNANATTEQSVAAASSITAPGTVFTITGASTTISTMVPPTGMVSTSGDSNSGWVFIKSDSSQTINSGSGANSFFNGFTMTANTLYTCTRFGTSSQAWYCK